MGKSVVSVFLAFLAAGFLAAAPIAVRVGGDAWEPYTMDPSKGQPGYIVEILKAIFAEPAYALDYSLVPFVRASREVAETGELDVLPGVLDKYPGFIINKVRVGVCDIRIVARKGDPWEYSGIDSFKGRKIGFARTDPDMLGRMLARPVPGSSSTPFAQAVYMAARAYKGGDKTALQIISGENMIAQMIQMLAMGRIDLILEDRVVVTYLSKKLGLQDKIEFREAGSPSLDLYLGFSPKNPASQDLADYFDLGLKELRASGKLKVILARYGLGDWE